MSVGGCSFGGVIGQLGSWRARDEDIAAGHGVSSLKRPWYKAERRLTILKEEQRKKQDYRGEGLARRK